MNNKDNVLYYSIFVTFLGFILFALTILNRSADFIPILHRFFALFLLASIIMIIVGMNMMIKWHISTGSPIIEGDTEKVTKTKFAPFLIFGILCLLIGITIRFSFHNITKLIYYSTLVLNILGILMLINGLKFFVKEVIYHNVKK